MFHEYCEDEYYGEENKAFDECVFSAIEGTYIKTKTILIKKRHNRSSFKMITDKEHVNNYGNNYGYSNMKFIGNPNDIMSIELNICNVCIDRIYPKLTGNMSFPIFNTNILPALHSRAYNIYIQHSNIKNNIDAVNILPIYLQNSKNIIIERIKMKTIKFNQLTKICQHDKNIVIELLNNNDNIYGMLSPELKNDMDVINESLKHKHNIYKLFPDNIKNNKKIIFKMIINGHDIYKCLSDEHKMDKKIIKITCETDDENFNVKYISKYILATEKEFIFKLININSKLFELIFDKKYGLPIKYIDEYLSYCQQLLPKNMVKRNTYINAITYPNCEYSKKALHIIKQQNEIKKWNNINKHDKYLIFAIVLHIFKLYDVAYCCYHKYNKLLPKHEFCVWDTIFDIENRNDTIAYATNINNDKHMRSLYYYFHAFEIYETSPSESEKYLLLALDFNPLNVLALLRLQNYNNKIKYYENALTLSKNMKEIYDIILT
jgi:hypothetical protein